MDPEPIPTQPEPVIPQPAPPARKFKLLLILTVVILLIAVGAGGVLLVKSLNTSQLSTQPTVAPLPTQIPTSTPDETANWKTLADSDLGISFKYPQDWTKDEEDPTGMYIYAKETFGGGPEPLGYYIFGGERKNPDGLTFEELVTKDLGEDLKQQFKFSQEIIGGYTVYKTDKLPSRSGALNVFFTRDGANYIVIGLAPYNSQTPFEAQNKYLEIFDQILATVKFLD